MRQLNELIGSLPVIKEIVGSVQGAEMPFTLVRVSKEMRLHLLHLIHEMTGRDVVYVTRNDLAAYRLMDSYQYRDAIYLDEPKPELRPVEASDHEVRHKRIRSIFRVHNEGGVVFCSAKTLLFKMRKSSKVYSQSVKIRKGQIISPDGLMKLFTEMGYEHVAMIERTGQFSGRGEIVEVYTPNYDDPLRINFFDDEIETIKFFDSDTQRSAGDELKTVEIIPSHELVLDADEKKAVSSYLSENDSEKLQGIKEEYLLSLDSEGSFSNMEAYMGLLPETESILGYMKAPVVIFEDLGSIVMEQKDRCENREKMFAEILLEQGAFGAENGFEYDIEDFAGNNRQCLINIEDLEQTKLLGSTKEINVGSRALVSFGGSIDMFMTSVLERVQKGFVVVICAGGKIQGVKTIFDEREVPYVIGSIGDSAGIYILPQTILEGFELPDEKIVCYSEEDILGTRRRRNIRKRSKAQNVDFLADLHYGDIVVHIIHGKGRFIGLRTLVSDGASGEYLEIEYRDGGKLFVPTSQIDRVDKYIGPDDENVMLSKLGSREWDNAKKKARANVKALTEDIVSIYRERSQKKGYEFSEDTVWQRQFEDNFAYDETPGQEDSIHEIKKDMESSKIMDRLLLGDVGYGKTEVAMRACFKAVMDSKQVAVLVPTTLLARQHYKNFVERFMGFPVRIELLSRYTKKPKEVLERLRTGQTDIVIGTHKLLSKSVQFKDLGLLVIDEEHRFGVSHKERIKDYKRTVDVLTLTATPIPRTLEMALTGIRDISTIDTPPEVRKETQAYVVPFDWSVIRDAILKEMRRGGQVYFVCRKISEMDRLLTDLNREVPEARVTIAHGQMTEMESEAVMNAFYEHEYDVLLCTTIIESGIDIPSVNTIIIYEADKFGLSQLYQLRGRIGRGNVTGYAYFTHEAEKNLSETAVKRLEAIREFTQLGSGLKIAMRDLQIRGAGNILGAEQSGHMADVGYNLYFKMIKEEISNSVGNPIEEKPETSVEIGEDAYIPGSYIEDEGIKLDMYRKVLGANTIKRAKELQDEFTDRFGEPPSEVKNLILVSLIKSAAERAKIVSVARKRDTIQIKFAENIDMNVKRLADLIQSTKGKAELRKGDDVFIVYGHRKGTSYTELLQFMGALRHCFN
ncbi:MAG: transcription-repair coupling factor [Clostridia bacterium]|nr:transcription-repair coupling factor [Clostridia bacterium]